VLEKEAQPCEIKEPSESSSSHSTDPARPDLCRHRAERIPSLLQQPPFTAAAARELMMVMQATPYGHVLFGLQIVCGFLLLARLFVPIALTILAGYLFNIYMFHIFLDHAFNPLALFASVLWALTFLRHRDAFRTILRPRPLKTAEGPQ